VIDGRVVVIHYMVSGDMRAEKTPLGAETAETETSEHEEEGRRTKVWGLALCGLMLLGL